MLNENADPTVRKDMETSLNRIAPEDFPYVHDDEGPDDMVGRVHSVVENHRWLAAV
jgi:thiamine phosphate synthase YjbQ (UPF0047 family)